jgi:hypothetical protein
MADSPTTLQERKSALLRQISQLDDFRPGSITTTARCGNPHCHQPGHPGRGLNFPLIRLAGKPSPSRSPLRRHGAGPKGRCGVPQLGP